MNCEHPLFFPDGITCAECCVVVPVDVPHARRDDPRTSKLAGQATEALEGTTTVIRPSSAKHVALRLIVVNPSTANEVARESGKRGLWKRVSDLKNAQLIEDSGETRLDLETRREGIVWRATSQGRSVLGQLDRNEAVRL